MVIGCIAWWFRVIASIGDGSFQVISLPDEMSFALYTLIDDGLIMLWSW